MEFVEEHKSDRAKFEILTIHDPSAPDFATLDPKLEALSTSAWGGKKLPFPIILDKSGATLQAWGIHAFPTAYLISPDGKIAASGHPNGLEKRLEAELKKMK